MRNILKKMFIIQERTYLDEFKHKRTKRRLNPYNPLTYIAILLALIVAIIMFGVVGFKDQISINELKFKWI